ncbi:MAG: HAMP domain-containing sensor histidine kinase [Rhizobiaceae bacterium]
MTKSLGVRLFAGAVIFLGIALFLTWLALSSLFQSYVNGSYSRELLAVSDTIAAGIAVDANGLTLRREPTDPRFQVPAGGRYWQVEGLSGGLQRSRSLWDMELKHLEPLSGDPALFYTAGPGGGDVVVLHNEVSFERNGKTHKAMISVGADQAEYEAASAQFRGELLKMLGLTGVFLAFASGLQIFVGLQPLKRIRKAVVAVRQGLAPHIDDYGPVEVRPLVAEINTLLAAERGAVERARARASDLAHGLKTPLTILTQISETLAKSGDSERAARLGEQVSAIRQRTDRQLALARAGGRGSARIDAGELSGKLVKVVTPVAAAKQIALENRVLPGTIIRVDATDFAEAVGNLIDNAIAHAKGHVVISAEQKPGTTRITVSDDGMGIDAKDRATALVRGQRLDESSAGTGLGLAITADILRAYGGSISLDSSAMGGLAVYLDWPKDRKKHDANGI